MCESYCMNYKLNFLFMNDKKKKPAKGLKKKPPEKKTKDIPAKNNTCLNCGDYVPPGYLYCLDCEEDPADFDIYD